MTSLVQRFGANEVVMVSVMLREEEGDLESKMTLTTAVMTDESHSRVLCTLMGGCARTATGLSAVASVSASTASAHPARLCEQRFVVALVQGRHRYSRLAGSNVAELLERLMGVAWATSTPRRITAPSGLRHTRTCYDHLVREVAVGLFDTLVSRQWLAPDGEALTPLGLEELAQMGIILVAVLSRRKLTCGRLGWSKQRYHPNGVPGAMLLRWSGEQRWVKTEQGSRHIIPALLGIHKLETELGVRTTR